MTKERGEQLAVEYGIKFVETSAKASINVEEAFYTLASDIKAKMEKRLVRERDISFFLYSEPLFEVLRQYPVCVARLERNLHWHCSNFKFIFTRCKRKRNVGRLNTLSHFKIKISISILNRLHLNASNSHTHYCNTNEKECD